MMSHWCNDAMMRWWWCWVLTWLWGWRWYDDDDGAEDEHDDVTMMRKTILMQWGRNWLWSWYWFQHTNRETHANLNSTCWDWFGSGRGSRTIFLFELNFIGNKLFSAEAVAVHTVSSISTAACQSLIGWCYTHWDVSSNSVACHFALVCPSLALWRLMGTSCCFVSWSKMMLARVYWTWISSFVGSWVFLIFHLNLVDPASSDMLVSKIKPCKSKYKSFLLMKLRTAH